MSEEETKSSVVPIVAGVMAALVLGLAVFVGMSPPAPETTATANAPAAAAAPQIETSALDPSQSAADATPDQGAEAEPPASAEAVSDPQPNPQPAAQPAPQFDTFRVEADGAMVIAGRAEPGQTVAIILGGAELTRVPADSNGSFVAFAQASPADQPRRLVLVADPDGAALESETGFVVAPIAAPVIVAAAPEPEVAPEPAPTDDTPASGATAEAVTEDETATPADSAAVTAEAAPATESASESATELAAMPEPTAAPEPAPEPAPVIAAAPSTPAVPDVPTVIETGQDGVRILQGTGDTENVALDTITYDTEGDVQIAGRATGDGTVEVYLDNEPILSAPVAAGGDWRADLPEVDTGVYTLRIDEVDAEGEVVSRIETPFKREERGDVAAVLADQTAQDGFEVAMRTVQPGATLWAIAEEQYGRGILYVAVFEANVDQIRDPDLIYPGQIFRLPVLEE